MEILITKGYKVTDKNGNCRDFHFELNKNYIHEGKPIICESGFHFCTKLSDCFSYYTFDPNNLVFEIEAYGDIDKYEVGDSKCCTNNIKLIKQLNWYEVLNLVNIGRYNTGRYNTGHSNTGSSNTGNGNTGNGNTGSYNTGNGNFGSFNSGSSNTGNYNTGRYNTGNGNSGSFNSGSSNTGNYNTGRYNTGNGNSGSSNKGHSNSGNSNTGNFNSGSYNTGNFSRKNAEFTLFEKSCKTTREEFINSKAFILLNSVKHLKWITEFEMTEEEKLNNESYKTTGGFLKKIEYKEAFIEAWDNWNEKGRNEIKSIENFDAEIFYEITGIKI